jgi:hypothetical protein
MAGLCLCGPRTPRLPVRARRIRGVPRCRGGRLGNGTHRWAAAEMSGRGTRRVPRGGHRTCRRAAARRNVPRYGPRDRGTACWPGRCPALWTGWRPVTAPAAATADGRGRASDFARTRPHWRFKVRTHSAPRRDGRHRPLGRRFSRPAPCQLSYIPPAHSSALLGETRKPPARADVLGAVPGWRPVRPTQAPRSSARWTPPRGRR